MPGPRRTRRIIHVIEPLAFGGAESVVAALSRGAAARGDRVLVAALRQDHRVSPLLDVLRDAGVAVAEIACGRRRYLREAATLAEIIRRERPDVVHTHVYHADVVGFLAARRARAPVVATVHGFVGGGWKGRFYESVDLAVLRRMDAVLCVSETVAARVRGGLARPRVHLVPNGHAGLAPLPREEARRRLGIAPDAVALGWIGRLSPEKGPDRFVDVIAALERPAVGVLVGDGPARAATESRAAAAGARVVFAGALPEAGRLVTAFDLLLITSRTEGLPMTLLDAMSAGVPVAAFAVGAVPDALADGAGWVVPADDVPAFTAAVRAAVDDAGAARARADRARRALAERYSLEGWLARVDAVYDGVAR